MPPLAINKVSLLTMAWIQHKPQSSQIPFTEETVHVFQIKKKTLDTRCRSHQQFFNVPNVPREINICKITLNSGIRQHFESSIQ